MSQFKDDSGMQELAKIVAGLYKDVKLLKRCSTEKGAQDYVNAYHKDQGWTVHKNDITGPKGVPDGVDEIYIKDKDGNIRVINGYTTKPSKFAERQAYYTDAPVWTDEELNAYIDPETHQHLTEDQKDRRRGKPSISMKEFIKSLYEPQPVRDEHGIATGAFELAPRNVTSGAAKMLRKNRATNLSPRRVFMYQLKLIWDTIKDQFLENKSTEDKMIIYREWSNLEYLNRVIVPTLTAMGIDYETQINYRDDLNKIMNKSTFKTIANQTITDVFVLNPQFDEIQADLQEFGNRDNIEDTAARLYHNHPKPYKPNN